MLLATGTAMMVGRVLDGRARKKKANEERHQLSSALAKKAFISQTGSLEDAKHDSDTDSPLTPVKFESPEDVATVSTTSADDSSSRVADGPWHAHIVSPSSPASESPTVPPPPPYSVDEETHRPVDEKAARRVSTASDTSVIPTVPSPSIRGPGDFASLRTTSSSASSTVSGPRNDPTALRIKTLGAQLDSGFPYHPALFDLHVRPDDWDSFTGQIVTATKLSPGDTARIVAAATATALTGAIGTSVWVGRTMNRKLREKRVEAGLLDMQDGGLGDILERWNNEYFYSKGLSAHLELSEAAMKSQAKRSKTVRLHASLHPKREEREKRRDERKFVMVVSKLDEEGCPSRFAHTMQEDGTVDGVSEMEGSIPSSLPPVAELEDEKAAPTPELPADEPIIAELPATPIAELDGTPMDQSFKQSSSPTGQRSSLDSLSSASTYDEDLKKVD